MEIHNLMYLICAFILCNKCINHVNDGGHGKYSTHNCVSAFVCLGVVVGGGQVEGLVGKVAGVRTMIAASKRGLHRFPLSSCTCHYGITDATSTFFIQHCSAGKSLQNTSALI